MGDTGLLCAALTGNVQLDVLQGSLEVNLGSTVENAVAQELHSHVFGLHFFNSKREGGGGQCRPGRYASPARGGKVWGWVEEASSA